MLIFHMFKGHTPITPKARVLQRGLLTLLLAVGPLAVQAQGGPPMVTDDPGTPGDGNWEINLASLGQHSQQGWLYTVLDADINYGWGDRLQLKVDSPWNATRSQGAWAGGSGTTLFGVKWRFYDDDATGWAISTYPQLGLNLQPGSVRRGLAAPGKSFLLPVETTTHLGPVDIDMELGRNFEQDGTDSWIAGLILAHTYANRVEVMAEVHEQWSPAHPSTLLNLGTRWEIDKGLSVMGALGREVGAADPSRLSTLAYLGFQLRR